MLTPLYLLIGLTVATCVIAYWADNLGKKLGKKRISLFGLRPRQTATLISMASSVGIMMLTMVVLIVFNHDLRRALFRYDFINRQNQELTLQAGLLQGQVSDLTDRSKTLHAGNIKSEKKLHEVRQELKGVKGHLGDARQKLAAAQEGEATAKQNERQAEQQAAVARSRFAAAENRLEQTLDRLKKVDVRLSGTRQDLTQARSRLTQARTNLIETRTDLLRVRNNLAGTMQLTKGTLASLRDAKIKYEEEVQAVARLQGQVEQQKAEVTRLELQQKDLEEGARRLTLITEKLYAAAEPLTKGNVMLKMDQVLAAQTLPAHVSTEQARSSLNQLIADAGKLVTRMGVQSFNLAPIRIELPNTRPVVLDEEGLLGHLTNYLKDSDVPISVRLVSTRFYAEGETEVMGRMVTLPVRATFGPGEEIASATIDGTQSDARIFNQLLKVINEGEMNARERGMQPLLTEESPNFYANETNERIFEALRRIQNINGSAKVRLVAASRLTTVDQMHVRFDVSKQG